MTNTSFSELGIAEPLCRALAAENYTSPTPIQGRAIPSLLAGRDLIAIAQTGTGKTAAFALPLLQHLAETREPAGARGARALILAPTRELAIQIGDSIRTYGRHLPLRHALVYGGVGQGPQVKALARGVDILVATPGRLLDLMGQGHIRLDRAGHLVLDEADRMLDMGFIRDVRKIVAKLPKARQSLLFSATMPADVERLAAEILTDPLRVQVSPEAVTVDLVEQHVYHVDTAEKRALLDRLLRDPALDRVIVFTRTKHRANRVAKQLDQAGVAAQAIHGNKSQNARQRALEGFRAGRVRVLVATDVAARGIDIDGVSHVVNYELPNLPESYVHRIGRTARAGAAGIALSFCDATERPYLRDIERLVGRGLSVVGEAPRRSDERPKKARPPQQQRQRRRRRAEQVRRAA
ncbi:MAG: DEAD/DEAH box helicase [Alphaproteobacteria bacterium]|nr:DEAD/DEAH box helicase [Alphaproteobacteria bacterium]